VVEAVLKDSFSSVAAAPSFEAEAAAPPRYRPT
jgi:hypothetical protein